MKKGRNNNVVYNRLSYDISDKSLKLELNIL